MAERLENRDKLEKLKIELEKLLDESKKLKAESEAYTSVLDKPLETMEAKALVQAVFSLASMLAQQNKILIAAINQRGVEKIRDELRKRNEGLEGFIANLNKQHLDAGSVKLSGLLGLLDEARRIAWMSYVVLDSLIEGTVERAEEVLGV